jgi:hypothetical protein
MSIYINKDKKLAFIHIVKNGGLYTSNNLLSFYNFERYEGLIPISVDIKYFLSTFNKSDQLKIINKTNKIILDGYFSIIDSDILNYKYFCVVRCPYQRFISGILYSKSYIFNIDMNNLKNFIINKENFKNGLYNDLLTYSHVFVTQSQYIKNIPNLTILNFENIDKELCIYLKENGFDIKHNENSVPKNSTFKDKNFWEYYDKFVFNFVNEYFDEDFKNFNFPKYTSLIDFYYQMNKKYNSLNF